MYLEFGKIQHGSVSEHFHEISIESKLYYELFKALYLPKM